MRRIAAVSVNHNTSLYVELMLRSHFANHRTSSAMVGHFSAVSYDYYGEGHLSHHAEQRNVLLRQFRERDPVHGATCPTGALG